MEKVGRLKWVPSERGGELEAKEKTPQTKKRTIFSIGVMVFESLMEDFGLAIRAPR